MLTTRLIQELESGEHSAELSFSCWYKHTHRLLCYNLLAFPGRIMKCFGVLLVEDCVVCCSFDFFSFNSYFLSKQRRRPNQNSSE